MDQHRKLKVELYDTENVYVYRNVDEGIREDVKDMLNHAQKEGVGLPMSNAVRRSET